MNRLSMSRLLLIPLGLMFFGYATSALAAPVTCDCGKKKIIYHNKAGRDMLVTVQASDNCEGGTTKVYPANKSGRGNPNSDASMSIKDGETNSFSTRVPMGGTIVIKCEGEGGNCQYEIIGASRY